MARECNNYYMIFSSSDKELIEDINKLKIISKERMTVLCTTDISQYSLNVLLYFDIILSNKSLSETDLIKFKSEQLNTEQEKRLKLLIGKNNRWNNLVKKISSPYDSESEFNQLCIDYMERLMADKSNEQLVALNKCFFKAKNENMKNVLQEESVQFFKLINILSFEKQEVNNAR